MKKLFVLTVMSLIIAGCATEPVSKKKTFLSDVESGGILRINSPLTIPAGEVRASLQYSKQLSAPGAVNQWEPYCQMVVNTIDKKDKEIPAIDFRVLRVVRDEEPYSRKKDYRRSMIASTSNDLSFMVGGANTDWLIKTYFYIESDQYPDIYRFVCAQAWDGYLSRRMYMDEFYEAVGNYISLLPAGTK